MRSSTAMIPKVGSSLGENGLKENFDKIRKNNTG